MRNQFIETLTKLALKNPKIVLVVGDLGYGVVEPFAESFPDRFFNSGVAEQNMMGFSAGLASEGHHVYVYSIANFPIFRCAEQIRNDVCYHNLDVTIVSVGGGLSYGNLGYSHHAIQDYAFMRTLPNMKILSPGDPTEVKKCLEYLDKNPCPSYLRLGKTGEKHYSKMSEKLDLASLNSIRKDEKANKAIISTGAALQDVMNIRELDGLSLDIFSCPIWGINLKIDDALLEGYERVIIVEDHLKDAGFGSWILENTDKLMRDKFDLIGLEPSVAGMVGSQSWLNSNGGISPEDILKSCL